MHAFGVLLLAAETTVQSKNPILPAVNEIVWGTVSFAVLFVLMRRFAFPAVRKSMEARTERIRSDLAAAEGAKTDAATILAQYQAQLADAKNESNRIIEEARQTADQLRQDLMAKAEADAAELRQRATADIQAAKDRALQELQAQLSSLAIDLAEKIVEHNLDRPTNTALVESYIAKVGSQTR
jgi:F-type H+-transporting ATPase subunit b